jgi:hypothetical protein
VYEDRSLWITFNRSLSFVKMSAVLKEPKHLLPKVCGRKSSEPTTLGMTVMKLAWGHDAVAIGRVAGEVETVAKPCHFSLVRHESWC